MKDFTNLHLHTMYSLQDSIVKVPELIDLLKEYGQNKCAITDHASLAGHYEFYKECVSNEIKPILGNEFYTVPFHNKTKNRFHLVLLAKNQTGLMNLRKLQRIAVEHHHYRPIISYKDLFMHKEGLFLSTACSLSPVSQAILNNRVDAALDIFEQLYNKFGKENFAVEWQFHPEYSDQSIINERLLEFYDKFDIKYPICTFDTHFLRKEDRETRRIIQAISWHKELKDIKESLKSNCLGTAELAKQFAEESGFSDLKLVDKMINNTNKIADLCNTNFGEKDRKIPVFDKYKEYESLLDKAEW